MKNKSYAVIGLGQFGMTVALTLAEANCDVLAIDDKDDNVQDIAEKVSYAVKADVRDPGILESLGVQNVDVAVIAVAENMEASITATMQVKELGVPFVMAKAMNSLHGRILEKIGADKVIYPEKQVAKWASIRYADDRILDYMEVDASHAIFEVEIPYEWIGKTIGKLDIRKKHNINILAVKNEGGEISVAISADTVLNDGSTLLVLGDYKTIQKCFHI